MVVDVVVSVTPCALVDVIVVIIVEASTATDGELVVGGFSVYTMPMLSDPQHSPALPEHGVQEPVAPTLMPEGPLKPQIHESPSIC